MAEERELEPAGIWINPGPAVLLVRPAGWLVLPPGTDRAFIEEAWHLLEHATGLEDLIDALRGRGDGQGPGPLPALVGAMTGAGSTRIAVHGTTPMAVYTGGDRELYVGTGTATPTIHHLTDVDRLAFGELPTGSADGAPRMTEGICRIRGFVHQISPPEDLGADHAARLREAIQRDGTAIEMPPTDPLPTGRAGKAGPRTAEPAMSDVPPAERPESSPAHSTRTEPTGHTDQRRTGEVVDATDVVPELPAPRGEGRNRVGELLEQPTGRHRTSAHTSATDPAKSLLGPSLLAHSRIVSPQPSGIGRRAGNEPAVPDDAGAYDHLFGGTLRRRIEDAAVRREHSDHDSAATDLPAPPGDAAMSGEGPAIPVPRRPPAATKVAQALPSGIGFIDTVPLLESPTGFVRVAMTPVRDEARPRQAGPHDAPVHTRPAPMGAHLVSTDDERIFLDAPVIIGRTPRTHTIPAAGRPRLITVAGPHQDVSRSHLAVYLHDGAAVAEDLGSINGTLLCRPDGSTRHITPGQSICLTDGDVVEIAEGVRWSYRECA